MIFSFRLVLSLEDTALPGTAGEQGAASHDRLAESCLLDRSGPGHRRYREHDQPHRFGEVTRAVAPRGPRRAHQRGRPEHRLAAGAGDRLLLIAPDVYP